MSQAVRDARGVLPVEHRSALTVEVHGGLVHVEFVEHRSERSTPLNVLGGCRIAGVHLHLKISVLGEQRHLTGSITPIGTVGAGVDYFSDSQRVDHLSKRKIRMRGAPEISRVNSFAAPSRSIRGSPHVAIGVVDCPRSGAELVSDGCAVMGVLL